MPVNYLYVLLGICMVLVIIASISYQINLKSARERNQQKISKFQDIRDWLDIKGVNLRWHYCGQSTPIDKKKYLLQRRWMDSDKEISTWDDFGGIGYFELYDILHDIREQERKGSSHIEIRDKLSVVAHQTHLLKQEENFWKD